MVTPQQQVFLGYLKADVPTGVAGRGQRTDAHAAAIDFVAVVQPGGQQVEVHVLLEERGGQARNLVGEPARTGGAEWLDLAGKRPLEIEPRVDAAAVTSAQVDGDAVARLPRQACV